MTIASIAVRRRRSGSSASSRKAFCASLFAREKDAVDARRHAGRRERFDELRLPVRHAVAPTGKLKAVRYVEHDGNALRADDRKGPHVHHEVVISEAGAAFGDEHARVACGDNLGDCVLHVVWRKELSFLDVDDATGLGGGHQEIGLPAQERGDLEDIGDIGRRSRLLRLVNVREDRHAAARLDRRENAEALIESGTAKGRARGAVRLVERRFEDERHVHAARDVGELFRERGRVGVALDHARPGDEDERVAAASTKSL